MSDENNRKKIILMGPVGSGKSTQADLLAGDLGVPRIEMGQILRELSRTRDDVKALVEAGKLVPDVLTLELIADEISNPQYKNGFVLDGAPRNLYQAQNLPFQPDIVIYLRVSDEVTIERLVKRGRPDDTRDLIAQRLSVYHNDTAPVLDFYRAKGALVEVDGEPPIEVIFEDILDKLKIKS